MIFSFGDDPVLGPLPNQVYGQIPNVINVPPIFPGGGGQLHGPEIAAEDRQRGRQAVANAEQRAYDLCRENYLTSHYGTFLGRKLIPFFSLGTLWDAPGEYAKSAGEAAVVKGVPIFLAQKYGGTAVKAGLHVAGKAAAWAGAAATLATTAADLSARHACGAF